MLKALLISIYRVDKRALEKCAGIFPAEADVSTHGVWVTDKVFIPVTARRGERIRLEGIYFPESIEKQTGSGESTIRFLLCGTEIYATQLRATGEFAIEFPVPKFRGSGFTSLIIESSKAFVPKSIGPSEDERKLAWRLKTLSVGNQSAFNCTHHPAI